MDLSVVVVSYNTAPLLERCLRSILASAPERAEVFVVDNASSDGSVELVRERFPGVRLIANAENRGFGAASNQAIALAAGRYVALVNSDCEVDAGCLPSLVAFMEVHPRAAVAGGRLRYADGTFQHSAFRFPTLLQIALDFFPLNWRLTESRLNGRFPRSWDGRPFQMDYPLGALMCVRRRAIDQVGGFDERFFMYAEEVDWCLRFKRAGWEVWHCPAATAVHHGGRSTRQRPEAMLVQLHRSRLLLYRKHYPRSFQAGARALLWLGATWTAATEWLADRRAGGTLPERRQRARAHLQLLRL